MPLTPRVRGRKQLRNLFGGSAPRYTKTKTTYNPISDKVEEISPAQQHMLTFPTRWMQDFQINGIRMDSVEKQAASHCLTGVRSRKKVRDDIRNEGGDPFSEEGAKEV